MKQAFKSVFRVLVTLTVVLAAIAAGYWLWHHYLYSPWTRDARVRADVVTIAPDVSGWVGVLNVRDNQQVEQGELLMVLDKARYEASLAQARAVEQTRREQLIMREREASRRAKLGTEAISAELRENAQISERIARGEYQQAQAQVRFAELDLSRSEVRAPRSGQVTNLRLAQGNYVHSGEAVMALVDQSSFYIQAYFEETKLARIRVGAPVEIRLMGGEQRLEGEVESISSGITDRNATPDGQLLANVEPTFNWVRLAQRIPVRIRFKNRPADVQLSAGMTASVNVIEP